MKIKRYYAQDIRRAIKQVRDELGPEAVILSNQRVSQGVEIVAAIDYDESFEPLTSSGLTDKDSDFGGNNDETGTGPGENGINGRPGTQNIWTQDPVITEMRDEIKVLKDLLRNQLSGLAWNELGRSNPVNRELLERLNQLGFSDNLCKEIAREYVHDTDPQTSWRQALANITDRIRTPEYDLMSRGGVYALVGPTGAGKTTTVAKIAARYAMENSNARILLITIDNFRMAAYEQLMVYGRIMGIPVIQVENNQELNYAIHDHYDKELILIDTAGMSQYDSNINRQVGILDQDSIDINRALVLPANMQYTGLMDVVRAFGRFNPDEAIITKLDECTSLGNVISAIIEEGLKVRYLCDGQQVPEDIHVADPHRLVSRSVALNKKFRRSDQEMMALNLGRVVVDAHH